MKNSKARQTPLIRSVLLSVLSAALFTWVFVLVVRTEEVDLFEPEADWKEIKDGQVLPAGLEIRMNLDSGKKEARLLPQADSKHDDNHHALGKAKQDKMDDIAALVHGHKAHMDNNQDKKTNQDGDNEKEGANLDLESKHEWWLNQQVDSANLVHLVNMLHDNETILHHRLDALNLISEIVHDVDHANYLKAHGLDKVLELLGHRSRAIRIAALSVIASASQNNPSFQEAFGSRGGVELLAYKLQLESKEDWSPKLDIEQNVSENNHLENKNNKDGGEAWPVVTRDDVRFHLVSALSSLSRGSRQNQDTLLSPSLISILIHTVKEQTAPYEDSSTFRKIFKVQGKIIQLLTDFLLEGTKEPKEIQKILEGAEFCEAIMLFRQNAQTSGSLGEQRYSHGILEEAWPNWQVFCSETIADFAKF